MSGDEAERVLPETRTVTICLPWWRRERPAAESDDECSNDKVTGGNSSSPNWDGSFGRTGQESMIGRIDTNLKSVHLDCENMIGG